jgi:hypothetical protein
MSISEKKRRIIHLHKVPQDAQHLVKNCFYCYSPRAGGRQVKAVVAVEVAVGNPSHSSLFFGICGNHAEVSPLSEEWSTHKTLGR